MSPYLRAWLALAVLLSPACASAPVARVHPFPLRSQIDWCHSACRGTALVHVTEDGPTITISCICTPNLGVHKTATRRNP